MDSEDDTFLYRSLLGGRVIMGLVYGCARVSSLELLEKNGLNKVGVWYVVRSSFSVLIGK